MCGIAGFWGGGDREALLAMTRALAHRGPDAEGLFLDDAVALGHRRLSVVDIRGGSQPMRDQARELTLVYNGEIYNHAELRRELEKEGHTFTSGHSDTETVLRAFAAWGPDCFRRFNGMFALALYDARARRLWLARDRFGEKPLFYARSARGFAFASEIGALRLWPAFDRAPDRGNIQRFFAWNYLPGERTIHRNCASVPPGSFLRLDLDTGAMEITPYWEYRLEPDEALTDRHAPELAEELRRLLVQAVKRRLLADVPLGIFLSGGLDSGAVLAAAVRAAEAGEIETFTIGFTEKSFDESAKAARVARHLGVRNHCQPLSQAEVRDSLGAVLSRMSEPFGDASLIPTFHLCAFARQHVTVALTGDGGDELLGGYDPLAAIGPARLYRRLVPGALHRLFRACAALVPAQDRNMSLEFRVKRLLRGLGWPETMQIPVWMSGLDPAEIAAFFERPLDAAELFADAVTLWRGHPEATPLEQAFLFFACLYLCDDILVKSDRASMQVSLETRAVFLDNDLVDFCRRLPMRFKYRNGKRKWLLKLALEPWLPPDILHQPKKGFGIPLNRWLRSLPAPQANVPGLKPGAAGHCRNLHKQRKGDFRYFLWDMQAWAHLAPEFA
ncbi:asparagine synthase (glutamine-hydrolyzing) [Desulfovibrio sp.]|uniref:asparagine synthase (glutamine-hydrolyzing) n=1 Tax=Desulfovibrio sp. TaxID=885 RepID=UPI0023BBEE53|nr:asparagine synthase (glutamine-hydrolyzing) [Desulfovibrio sp.]MDE7241143.1 asparagine synthase (glutamine-hydrolyzing) [Desulfovibrio sp.]